MKSKRIRELEAENTALTAQTVLLRSLLLDIAGEPLVDAYLRLGLVRHCAEELSAGALNLMLESARPADRVVAACLDRLGDHLRDLLNASLCVCGECEEPS